MVEHRRDLIQVGWLIPVKQPEATYLLLLEKEAARVRDHRLAARPAIGHQHAALGQATHQIHWRGVADPIERQRNRRVSGFRIAVSSGIPRSSRPVSPAGTYR